MEAESGHPLYLTIRQSNGYLIGMLAFQDDGVSELGYWLTKPWWGQGIMLGFTAWLVLDPIDHLQRLAELPSISDLSSNDREKLAPCVAVRSKI